MAVLEVSGLTKIYGEGESEVVALDNVSFSVEKGEFVAPFSIPIRVGGQTYNNQVLHDLVLNYSSPAELYGETTSFYIIGIATVIF